MDIDAWINEIDIDIPIYIDKLRIFKKGNQDKKIYNWVKKNYPQYIDKYIKILFEGDESYYKSLIEKYRNDKRITFMYELWGV